MRKQTCSQSPGGMTSHKAATTQKAMLQIVPCTVSQLLSASQVSNDNFVICDRELSQVSVVGVVRALSHFVTNIQYSVDDMTGPPLNVKQWVNAEDCALTFSSPGTYVKVTGSLRNYSGQRSLLAMDIRRIEDLNEITSHMLEVVQAHMQLFGEVFDVNMNTANGRALGYSDGGHPEGIVPLGLSTIQGQVRSIIRRFSVRHGGIGLHDLKTQLDHLSVTDLRTALEFLITKGLVVSSLINEEPYLKSTER
ncbi:replication protein A 32 kDa subunit-like [Pempheris klunzingeri]|uniref:replication protein A 32 kDa subunit-like n=1 Tax=Pempheris klunzingeri TaxID=3127111 RepID=UPI00397FB90E